MRVTVIIPVLNEEVALPEVMAYVRHTAASESVEIVVADGGSSDRTVQTARRLADRTLELSRAGRAYQMHQGALHAGGDILLFLHADTKLPEDWPAALERAWTSEPKPAATAFNLGFDSGEGFYRMITRTATWRTRLTGVPLGDQAIAVERETYLAAGGFPDVPLMEEYYLIRKLRKFGGVRVLPESVVTSTRRYERNGRILNNLRNTLITILFYAKVPPSTLARMYR